MTTPVVEALRVERLRGDLTAAGFTVDGIADRLGPLASAALHREHPLPAMLRTQDATDPCGVLVSLFTLGRPVTEARLAAALPSLGVRGALELGLVRPAPEADPTAAGAPMVRATCDVRPYADEASDWWVASDLSEAATRAPLPPEHVLGIGPASTTLASWTIRRRVSRALDLGTGSGVQVLHLAGHCAAVTATDLSERALAFAAFTAALNRVEVELLPGDLLAPVTGRAFDLVVSNPPFVIGAPAADAHTYRDAGRPLDDVGAHLARHAPAHLNPGGTFQMLANWVHRSGESWEERVDGWLPDGVTALVVQREVLDPAEYVGTWLRDAGEIGGPAYTALYDAWLRGLEERGVVAIGFGHVAVRRTDAARRVTTLDWPYAVEQPLGQHVGAWFTRQDFLARAGADLQRAHLRLAEDVVQEQTGPPGAEHPEHVVLRQQVGLRRATAVDTATAALAGACDGTLPVGVLVGAVREVLGPDQEVDEDALLERVRSLVEAGVLHPVG